MKTLMFEPELLTESVMQRFWAKTQPTATGCIEWTAAATAKGYGIFGIGQTLYRAHRISIVWATQKAIPSGLDVDHRCRNPKCVRPLHLEVVDRRTNIIRSTAKAASAAGEVECQRGHDLTAPRAWAVQPDGSRLCRLCRNIRWVEYSRRRGKK